MIDEITAKFFPRFATLARERLRNAIEVTSTLRHDSVPGVTRDMHALAGEAGLLGLEPVLDGARRAETAAKKLSASRSDEDAQALLKILQEIERAVAADSLRLGR